MVNKKQELEEVLNRFNGDTLIELEFQGTPRLHIPCMRTLVGYFAGQDNGRIRLSMLNAGIPTESVLGTKVLKIYRLSQKQMYTSGFGETLSELSKQMRLPVLYPKEGQSRLPENFSSVLILSGKHPNCGSERNFAGYIKSFDSNCPSAELSQGTIEYATGIKYVGGHSMKFKFEDLDTPEKDPSARIFQDNLYRLFTAQRHKIYEAK